MERPESGGIGRRGKSREVMRRCPPGPGRMIAVPPIVRAVPSEVKLAAIAADLNVRMRSADMPGVMRIRAFRCTRAILDSPNLDQKRPNPSYIAMCLKKEFDAAYGPAWHCIVGKSFGSFVTHSSGGFVYFSVDNLSFLLFKTEVRSVSKAPPLLKLKINA